MHHAKRITTLPSFLLTLQLLLALCFPLLTRSSHLTMFVFQPSLLSAFLLLQADSLFFSLSAAAATAAAAACKWLPDGK